MKYVLFTAVLLAAAYLLSLVSLLACKKKLPFSFDPLSKDVFSVCKGLAILLVMVSHAGNYYGTTILTPLGSWGVGIFLILSGYGLSCSFVRRGLKGYWKNRIVTAYLPYAAVELIGISFRIGGAYQNLDVGAIIKDLLLIDPIHPFGWYMQCLFLCYAAFYLAHRIFAQSKWWRYGVLILFSLSLYVFFRSLFKQQCLCFLAGVLLLEILPYIKRRALKWWSALLLLACGAGMLVIRQFSVVRAQHRAISTVPFVLQVLFLSLGAVLLLDILCRALPARLIVPFVYVGQISYELYLLHGFVFAAIFVASASYLRIALFFVISFAIAVLFYMLWRFLGAKLRTLFEKRQKGASSDG